MLNLNTYISKPFNIPHYPNYTAAGNTVTSSKCYVKHDYFFSIGEQTNNNDNNQVQRQQQQQQRVALSVLIILFFSKTRQMTPKIYYRQSRDVAKLNSELWG